MMAWNECESHTLLAIITMISNLSKTWLIETRQNYDPVLDQHRQEYSHVVERAYGGKAGFRIVGI